MKWVLIYWAITTGIGHDASGFTGQAYFETRDLCEKAHAAVTRGGAVKAGCFMTAPTEN
jgi:hypothetical protein